jgi:S-adenosylmethionine decarboxylase
MTIQKLESGLTDLGPEKLLEVWFASSAATLPHSAGPDGLKSVSAEVWKEMLELVNCKVLSIIESEDVDAYLLSESSMFVFPHKLILKTCGTTTLLWGIPKLLEIAAVKAKFPAADTHSSSSPKAAVPHRVFYSRKSFLFPDKQLHPHKSWQDEMKYLDKIFSGGSAYMIGKMNGEHWYLYLTNPAGMLTPPATPDRDSIIHSPIGLLTAPAEAEAELWDTPTEEADETLEILMTDLDVDNAKQFYLDHAMEIAEKQHFDKVRASDENGLDVFTSDIAENGEFKSAADAIPIELTTEGHALGTIVSDSCGLSDVYPKSVYPDARIDAYMFTPCGFSANGVVPAVGDGTGKRATHYFTVHVTPEPHCSYASFETNVPSGQSGRETADVIEHIVRIFRPGRFSVTLFEKTRDLGDSTSSVSSEQSLYSSKRLARMEQFAGYRRMDKVRHDLDGYDLVFRHFERVDFKGGAPILGEREF